MLRVLFGLGCVLLFASSSALGDAMVITRAMRASTVAEVFIDPGMVRVQLEIGAGDIEAFHNILPDAIYQEINPDAPPLGERLQRFFEKELVIKADGLVLPGNVVDMEPRTRLVRDDITGEPLPAGTNATRILYAELAYPFAGQPRVLSITPPTAPDTGFVSATIGMMAYHRGLPVMDFRYLSREETLELDWEDPWYSRFKNRNLWRQYNEPISVFLYAEPFETRVEVIVRPKDIQQWLDLGIAGLESLPVKIQPALKEETAAFLLENMELEVDGEVIVPRLQRINFLKRTLKSSTVVDPPEELDAISATLGVIYVVPATNLPQRASLTWNLFSPKMPTVRAAATDEAGPLPYRLREDDNVLVWNNYLKHPTIPTIQELERPQTGKPIRIPMASLICLALLFPVARAVGRRKGKRTAGVWGVTFLLAAAGLYPVVGWTVSVPVRPELEEPAATLLVSGLLRNIYTAFDFVEEETVYDALAQSLHGDLLSDVYLQVKQSLELQSQGGAAVKVKQVELEAATFDPASGHDGLEATCTWSVMGSVGHWGHIHQRINRYKARMSVHPVQDRWKITALTILEEARVQ